MNFKSNRMDRAAAKNYFSWMMRTEQQKVAEEIGQVYIELSTFCNLACITCVRHSIENFRPRHFSRALMRRLIPMLQSLPNLERIVLFGFGEALCNPDFIFHLKMLRKCDAKIIMVSNAFFITPEVAEFLTALPIDELYLSWDDNPAAPSHIRRGTSPQTFAQKISYLLDARTRHNKQIPRLGMEIVAMRSNANSLPDIVEYGKKAGIEHFIITNVFPYSEPMNAEILYSVIAPDISLTNILSKAMRSTTIRIANQNADSPRSCPFIEKGTAFITATGDIAPCPELAYTHSAWYFGSKRMHRAYRLGTVAKSHIQRIWSSETFLDFRKKFEYYEFPDCSLCREPDMCWHRTVDTKDCYGNETPCGECLWAKGIVLCP